MRICSFLPSATEIVYALGLSDSLVGVTYECDYPDEARHKPVVIFSNLQAGLPEREIDSEVKQSASTGSALYRLDADRLRELKPDLIIAQDLCRVCAASPNDLGPVLASLTPEPAVLTLTPHTVDDVFNDILRVGDATNRSAEAHALVGELRKRVAQVVRHQPAKRPRVLCLEWLEPPFAAGHWVPEMVAMAGGDDTFGRVGEHSSQLDWQAIEAEDPDLILAMPCGFHLREVENELKRVEFPEEWFELRAVREGKVFPVDASSYFSRPGPRIVEGIVQLAEIFDRTRKAPTHAKSA